MIESRPPVQQGIKSTELLESGEITKGTVTKKSDKIKEREMFKEAKETEQML